MARKGRREFTDISVLIPGAKEPEYMDAFLQATVAALKIYMPGFVKDGKAYHGEDLELPQAGLPRSIGLAQLTCSLLTRIYADSPAQRKLSKRYANCQLAAHA